MMLVDERQMGLLRDRFFYPLITQIMNNLSCTSLVAAFLFLIKLPEVLEYAEMQVSTNIYGHGHFYPDCIAYLGIYKVQSTKD